MKMGQERNQDGNKKPLEVGENLNTTDPDLLDTSKMDLRGKFIVLSTYFKNLETSHVNILATHMKAPKKK